jgi:hypothetical protein
MGARRVSTFQKIVDDAAQFNLIPAKNKAARQFFRTIAQQYNTSAAKVYKDEPIKNKKLKIEIGKLYLYRYDALHKATLPYWDKHPLVFFFGETPELLYGLNFHYLDYRKRAVLLDALLTISTDKKWNDNTKLNLTYKVLQSASKFKYFSPCIKAYRKDHVQSLFMEIHPKDWDSAIFLPIADFQKASQEKVWADSARKIRGK